MHTVDYSKELIKFKNLEVADLDLLFHWFQDPIINEQYAKNQFCSYEDIKNKYLPRIQGLDTIPSFIIFINHMPIGFIQYYCLDKYLPEGVSSYDNLLFENYHPEVLSGMDIFIAQASNRGKSLGPAVINKFIETQLMIFKAVLVDPEINNLQAIKCYEKAGFIPTCYSELSEYLLLMKVLS